MTRWSVCLLACLLAACAARRPTPQLLHDLGEARALVAAGCYACLTEALVIYERLAALPRAPADARQGAFEAALLLALRSKELGLPDAAPFERARAIAARLPAAATPRPTTPVAAQPTTPVAPRLTTAAYLAAAELMPGESSGFDPETRERLTRERRAAFGVSAVEHAARRALTPAMASDPLAAYLAIGIDCDDPRARKAIDPAALRQQHPTPLIRYRLARCALGADSLASLREADPRWQDTLLFEARREMTQRPVPDIGAAAALYMQAHQAFPTSAAVTMGLAAAKNALNEYDAALALYDGVLAESPTHRDALLGRVMSLSYLARHPDAIAAASQMIDLGTWHIGEAYYWRAWNRYQSGELELAWTDVEHATKLYVNSSVYMLAGVIAYARKALDTAVSRLQRSYELDNENCEAVWTESLVHVDMQAWTLAAPRFATGVTCFTLAAATARRDIENLEQAKISAALKSQRIALTQKRVETSEHRAAQSAFNAASSFLRLGQKSAALDHVDVAAAHPLLREKASALKAAVEKLP
jgi:tetratricopeptide (TPR) repeat protein